MTLYRIRQWEKFQHYKDRNPPWIRLYKGLLDDYDFHCLPVDSKALAPLLWLLASESKDPTSGVIDGTDERIAFRLHMTVPDLQKAIKPLISASFIESFHAASNAIASGKPHATPETETETESNGNQESIDPFFAFDIFWDKYPRQRRGDKKESLTAWNKAITKATEEEILNGLEAYIGSSQVRDGYAKGATAWLNAARWTWDYTYQPKAGNRPEKPTISNYKVL